MRVVALGPGLALPVGVPEADVDVVVAHRRVARDGGVERVHVRRARRQVALPELLHDLLLYLPRHGKAVC